VKALTVRQPYAELIADGTKTIEVRSRPTTHRGVLAIHAAQTIADGYRDDPEVRELPRGEVVCVVDVVGCRPLTPADVVAAWLPDDFDCTDLYAWELSNPRRVEPMPCKGALNLWQLPREPVLLDM